MSSWVLSCVPSGLIIWGKKLGRVDTGDVTRSRKEEVMAPDSTKWSDRCLPVLTLPLGRLRSTRKSPVLKTKQNCRYKVWFGKNPRKFMDLRRVNSVYCTVLLLGLRPPYLHDSVTKFCPPFSIRRFPTVGTRGTKV